MLTANSRDEEDFPSSTNLDAPYPLEGIIVHGFLSEVMKKTTSISRQVNYNNVIFGCTSRPIESCVLNKILFDYLIFQFACYCCLKSTMVTLIFPRNVLFSKKQAHVWFRVSSTLKNIFNHYKFKVENVFNFQIIKW